ncbi:GntR family transcriptional regulator [Streptomyces canus]|uniref:GntR family transcriptional regulator n=1 Tax=Streptomyces canus TaxID=58343 RepID=UPI002781D663|nr:GntR family transcriptional regulator [Streptomyces canus]MDQ0765578.1 DNA-binding FadR family transcriptional regulator [Streptomyces canus]
MDAVNELRDEEIHFLSPKRAGQAHRVYRGLREAITTGTIPPGTLLDSSRDLESGYKADRHVVAAALRGLAREGLVHLHHVGARVVDVPIQAAPKQTPEFVERAMRQRLAAGVYKPGTFLPRTSTIAKEFGLATPACRSAIQPLVHVGYLVGSVNPRGTLVTHDVAEVQPEELLTPASSRTRSIPHTQRYAAFGESKTLSDWTGDRRCAVAYGVLRRRLVESGWDFQRALTTPLLL